MRNIQGYKKKKEGLKNIDFFSFVKKKNNLKQNTDDILIAQVLTNGITVVVKSFMCIFVIFGINRK